MRFAPIPPASLAKQVLDLSDYLMVLPDLLDVDGMDEVVRQRSTQGAFVLLDNGVSERKTPLYDSDLQAYARRALPSELILPDTLGDANTTILAGRAQADWFSTQTSFEGGLMAVPQGRSLEQYMECVYAFATHAEITTIGLSKYFSKFAGRPRVDLLEAIESSRLHNRELQWHLLGLCEELTEITSIALRFPWLRGIDTCYPVLAAMKGWDITEVVNICTSPEGYFEAAPDEYGQDEETVRALVQRNITAFQMACMGRTL